MLDDARLAATSVWRAARSGALFRGTREWRRMGARARWLVLRYLGVNEVVLPFEGLRLIARTSDYAIGCQVYLDGHFGRQELERAFSLVGSTGFLQSGRPVFMDVGANIGTHTLYALKSRLFARVISVEPEARNFEQLRRNLLINGFDPDGALHAAFSNTSGRGLLALSTQNLGDHRVVRETGAARTDATETIELIDFAEVARRTGLDAETPVMFWIDTQGHEYEVLSGVPAETLRRSPFVIEYWPHQLRRNGTLDSLNQLLIRVATRFTVLQDGRQFSSAADLTELAAALGRLPPDIGYVDLLCFGSAC